VILRCESIANGCRPPPPQLTHLPPHDAYARPANANSSQAKASSTSTRGSGKQPGRRPNLQFNPKKRRKPPALDLITHQASSRRLFPRPFSTASHEFDASCVPTTGRQIHQHTSRLTPDQYTTLVKLQETSNCRAKHTSPAAKLCDTCLSS
jgi:hypothetical protein